MLIAMLTAVCARKIANRHRMLPVMAICGVNSNGWVLGSHRRNTIEPHRTVPVPVASFRFLMLVGVRMVRGSGVFVSCVRLCATTAAPPVFLNRCVSRVSLSATIPWMPQVEDEREHMSCTFGSP